VLQSLPEPAEVFVEAGVSGSVPLEDRPEGGRLMAIVRKGDVIITPKLDRMFRSAHDALGVFKRCKKGGIGLHMIDLNGDVVGNGMAKLMFTILSAFAEAERDRIRERIVDAKQYMASQGLFSGGKRQFGFNVVPEVVGGKVVARRLAMNLGEQQIISEMRRLRDQGMSLRAIGERYGKPAMSIKRILARPALTDLGFAAKLYEADVAVEELVTLERNL
jgi:DNA invertase Pin-like site-specific DNA recombinase